MAKQERRTGMEEAIAFSRKLPQIGVHPEIILEAGKRVISEIQPEIHVTTQEESNTIQSKK